MILVTQSLVKAYGGDLKNRLQAPSTQPLVKESCRSMVRFLEEELAKVVASMESLVAANARVKEHL